MTDIQPLPNRTNAVQDIRNRTSLLLAKLESGVQATPDDIQQLTTDIYALADDSDYWHTKADDFRKSYRIVKGVTDNRLKARIAILAAIRPHLPPCRFPSSPDCTCKESA